MTLIRDPKQIERCSRARNARDPGFDGLFFTAVKTTGIYCRSICPASPPKEGNVEYHDSAISAALAGYRPCLRCRPDSAPSSPAWEGVDTTLKRALSLIDQGIGGDESIEVLSDRLGVSSRYLRQLFAKKFGTSPKKYIIYQRCLLAKKLLQETSLPISEVAFAAGFGSVRRFNHAIKTQLNLSPSQLRKKLNSHDKGYNKAKGFSKASHQIELTLSYRPPFDWTAMLQFLRRRLIDGVEWLTEDAHGRSTYGRSIHTTDGSEGYFEVTPVEHKSQITVKLALDDNRGLYSVIKRIRLMFDLDAPISDIDTHVRATLCDQFRYTKGLRIPRIWNHFEAGVRAVLGQQVTVKQANSLVQLLVDELGDDLADSIVPDDRGAMKLFPTPESLLESDLTFFKMPQARKDTLHRLAQHFVTSENPEQVDDWGAIKGIGPWTTSYVSLRATNNSDVWLEGDTGVKQALKSIDGILQPDLARPWRSYLVFQLWQQL